MFGSDKGRILGGNGSPPGAWTLMGGGTTGEGFMAVKVDQTDMGYWTYVVLSRIGVVYSDAGVPIDWPTTQVAVLYWNGFVRLKTWVAPGDPDYRYGTSVVLGPFRPVDQDSTMVANPDLHSRIGTIAFDSTTLAQGNPAAVATGGWYSGATQGYATKVVDATWNLSWLAPTDSETHMHVEVDSNVMSDFALPNGRLGVGSLSSMWSSTHVHDSDTYSIGPLGGATLAIGAASALTVNQDTASVSIAASDLLSLTTTTSTTHNSGSPDLSLQITVTSWSN
jgi:hypothetical protein